MDNTRLYFAAGIALTIILVAFHAYFSNAAGYGNLVDVMTIVLVAFAALAAYGVYTSHPKEPIWVGGFIWMAAAEVSWLVAESIWGYLEIFAGITNPPLSLADLFWLIGYVPFTYFIYLAFRSVKFPRNAGMIVILSYLVLAFFAFLFLKDAIVSSENDPLVNLVNIAYVMGDILLLSLGIPLVYAYIIGQAGRAWIILAFAIAFNAIGDITYFALAATSSYTPSNLVSIFFLLGYLWTGLAALVYLEDLKLMLRKNGRAR